ncbi:hypothetical protein [Brevundimonas sp.]|uniref:hypothetical protein n=1 Tax=Brevundimonas sp. TaxID=1871086 RepID=UPI0025C321DF|nr:hypothetical protein [Brevundimonas sp.]
MIGLVSSRATFGVEGHLGRFSAADLSTFLSVAPAIRVAVLGVRDPVAAGLTGEDLDATVVLGVYVVTKDGVAKLSRDVTALAAVERILRLALGARWGLDFALPAQPGGAQNLFSGETLKAGRALWSIEINQPVALDGEANAEPPLGFLKELYIGVAPKVGTAHEADYLGPIVIGEGDHD